MSRWSGWASCWPRLTAPGAAGDRPARYGARCGARLAAGRAVLSGSFDLTRSRIRSGMARLHRAYRPAHDGVAALIVVALGGRSGRCSPVRPPTSPALPQEHPVRRRRRRSQPVDRRLRSRARSWRGDPSAAGRSLSLREALRRSRSVFWRVTRDDPGQRRHDDRPGDRDPILGGVFSDRRRDAVGRGPDRHGDHGAVCVRGGRDRAEMSPTRRSVARSGSPGSGSGWPSSCPSSRSSPSTSPLRSRVSTTSALTFRNQPSGSTRRPWAASWSWEPVVPSPSSPSDPDVHRGACRRRRGGRLSRPHRPLGGLTRRATRRTVDAARAGRVDHPTDARRHRPGRDFADGRRPIRAGSSPRSSSRPSSMPRGEPRMTVTRPPRRGRRGPGSPPRAGAGRG